MANGYIAPAGSPNAVEASIRASLKRQGMDYNPSTLGMVHRIDAVQPGEDEFEVTSDGNLVPIHTRLQVTCKRDGTAVKPKERGASVKREAVVEDDSLGIKSAQMPDPILTINGQQRSIRVNGYVDRLLAPVWQMVVQTLGWEHGSIVYTVCRKWLYNNRIRCPEVAQSLLSDVSTRIYGFRTAKGIPDTGAGGRIRIAARKRVAEWGRRAARQTQYSKPFTMVVEGKDGFLMTRQSPASLAYQRKGTSRRFDWAAVSQACDGMVLSDTERNIIMLHMKGLNHAQIAQTLGVGRTAVVMAAERMRLRNEPKIAELIGGLDSKEVTDDRGPTVDGDDNGNDPIGRE